jgi:hypothetical protein
MIEHLHCSTITMKLLRICSNRLQLLELRWRFRNRSCSGLMYFDIVSSSPVDLDGKSQLLLFQWFLARMSRNRPKLCQSVEMTCLIYIAVRDLNGILSPRLLRAKLYCLSTSLTRNSILSTRSPAAPIESVHLSSILGLDEKAYGDQINSHNRENTHNKLS